MAEGNQQVSKSAQPRSEGISAEPSILRMSWLTVGRVRTVMWITITIAGLLQALALRFVISGDGNSYLDVASAYLHRDFANAINGYWSPMYSWLIALVLWLFKPSAYWETTIMHLLDLAGILVTLRAFEFFVNAFLSAKDNFSPGEDKIHFPENIWWILCYGVFLSTMLQVLTLNPTSPDAWTCVATFLAMGLILKITENRGGPLYFAVVGFVLGVGYLTKHFYFPLAFVFMATSWLASRALRKNFAGLLCSLLAFALTAGPFVFALSRAKHRLTFGDAGKINYAFFMDQIAQPMFFWQGGGGSGTPTHASRIILRSPTVYEFAEPIAGSFPPWYDPSYWLDGVAPHFRLRNELKIARQTLGTFFLILVAQLEYFVALTAAVFCSLRARNWLTVMRSQWFLWLPPTAGCLGFASVLVEPRYVVSFVVILWVAAFGTLLFYGVASRELAVAMILAAVLATGIKTLKYAASDALAAPKQVHQAWEAAQKLGDLGARPGDRIALIGLFAEQHFLRLAQVKAVAELSYSDEQQFWTGDANVQNSVYEAFAATGSKVVVAVRAPVTSVKEGWIQLGNTDYYVHSLPAKH